MLAISVAEAARICAVRRQHIRAAIREGKLTPRAAGRRSVLLIADLEAWLQSLPPTKSPRREQAHA